MLIYRQNNPKLQTLQGVQLEHYYGVFASKKPTLHEQFVVGVISNYKTADIRGVLILATYPTKEEADNVVKEVMEAYERGENSYRLPMPS